MDIQRHSTSRTKKKYNCILTEARELAASCEIITTKKRRHPKREGDGRSNLDRGCSGYNFASVPF